MPYLDQSRPNSKSVARTSKDYNDASVYFGRASCFNPTIPRTNWATPLQPYDADERVYTYRTGKSLDGLPRQRRLSGEELRKLVYSGVSFDIVTNKHGELDIKESESSRDRFLFPYDSGHNFQKLTPRTQDGGFENFTLGCSLPNWYTNFWGEYFVPSGGDPLPLPSSITWGNTSESSSRQALANRLLSTMRPLAPDVSLIRFLGEFAKDGLPKLSGTIFSQVRSPSSGLRSLGSEYLNFVFALKPSVSDLKRIAEAVLRVNGRASTLRQELSALTVTSRDDRTLRREESIQSSTPILIWGPNAIPVGSSPNGPFSNYSNWRNATFKNHYGFSAGPGSLRCQVTTTYTRDFRVVAAWDVFVEDLLLHLDRMTSFTGYARSVLDMDVTPELIWDLTPWSWFVNWWFDLGGFLRKASAAFNDRMPLRYAYYMEHRAWNQVINPLRNVISPVVGTPFVPPIATFTSESKSRWRAYPYGFGVTFDGLSPFQVSVLAALGIANGSKWFLRET